MSCAGHPKVGFYSILFELSPLTTFFLGELLASAGDDGNVILWVPSETPQTAFGSDAPEDKESWRAKHMCRSSGAEIYDLAWSPDGVHFMIGSMDNIARIYNAQTGQHATIVNPYPTISNPRNRNIGAPNR
jgi:WD40 repeat protein